MKVQMALAFPLPMAGDTQDVACDQVVVSQVHSLDILHSQSSSSLCLYRVDLNQGNFALERRNNFPAGR